MNIHPSHSRKDLIEICEVFNIEIEDLYDQPKISLSNLLEPNQSKNVTIATKEKVMKDSRRIIAYCKSAYNLFPHFKTKDEVYECAKIVAEHCDISTCRRAIKLLNEDRSMPSKIEPIISNRMRKQLERKELVKKTTRGQFRSRQGSFRLDFN